MRSGIGLRVRPVVAASVLALFGFLSGTALAQTPPSAEQGKTLFDARCKSCHEPAIERAPNRGELAVRPPAELKAAMVTGAMAPMASGLSSEEIDSIVAYLIAPPQAAAASPRTGQPAPKLTNTMCATNPSIKPAKGDWATVGSDPANSRYQPNPGIATKDLPKLKVKWSFAIPAVGNSQPVVVGEWLWILSRGQAFALDPASGCVRYTIPGISARNSASVLASTVSPSGWLLIIGETSRQVRAFDAQTGKEIWKSAMLESHPASGMTGSPVVSGNQVFVPITSLEEVSGTAPNYACCTFRGSLVALDLKTGATQWKTFVIPEPLAPIRKTASGVQLQGPAGAAIWSAPSVDAKRGLVYVATGDSYTDADTKGADAIVAFDMKTGAIRWNNQVTEDDNYILGCASGKIGPNCPTPVGPDHDFGASPVLAKGKGGKEVLISGQKSGFTYGMDPDTGKLLWKRQVSAGSALGGIEWGIGTNGALAFAPASDIINLYNEHTPGALGADVPSAADTPKGRPGLTALDPATGKIIWHVEPPKAPCQFRGDRKRSDRVPGACFNAMSAAPAMIPGAVIQGTTDGWIRAYDDKTGKLIWEDSTTVRTYATTNGVAEQPGGSIDGRGATIANGRMFIVSGFDGAAGTGGNGTNVLLAYAVDGK